MGGTPSAQDGVQRAEVHGGFWGIGADRLPPVSSTKSFDGRVVGHAYALGYRT